MIKRQLPGLAVAIVFLMLYYAFFLDFVLSVKESIVNTLESHNLTSITIPVKEYNGTAWVERPKQFELVGFVDVALTLAIVFAPLLFIFHYVFRR